MNKGTGQDLEKSNITEVIESLNDITSVSTNSNGDSEDISNLMNDIFLDGSSKNHSIELNRIFHNNNDVFLNKGVAIKDSKNVKIGDITIFQGPVHFNTKYKVIENEAKGSIADDTTTEENGHTGTDIVRTQSENKYIIRYIQCYHIESERWSDIGYNFLIGADGYIYEGRGWGVAGNHTDNFNEKSIGIAFVGTYKEELPPQESLDALKILIETGIKKKFISLKYSLECQNTLVPSKYHENRLIDITNTWEY